MSKVLRFTPGVAGLIVLIVLAAYFISSGGTPANSALQPDLLISTEVGSAPTLDGTAESLWDSAPALTVPISGGWAGSLNVTLKSVYSGGNVYFLAQYSDPDLSLRRIPWRKDSGTWSQVPAKSPGWDSFTMKDPNAAYEDKFSMIWNIDNSIAGFNESGCAVACHFGVGAPAVFGRKYTNAPGEKGDMWHFKSVRTGPVTSYNLVDGSVSMVGQFDDQYVDNCTDPGTCPEFGRHSDPKTGTGGYVNNGPVSGLPQYTSPEMPAPPYWIPDATKQAFADTYNNGDELAGIIISAFTGDRGQLTAGSAYASGTWTLEFGRALVTPDQTNPAVPSANDIQFDDFNDEYFFGVAVFDNAQVEHSSSGNSVYRMVFSGGNPDDKAYHMPWFDNNSAAGMIGDWINIGNPGADPVTTEVLIGGVHVGSFLVAAGETVNVTAPSGTVGGPVMVACSHCQTTGDNLAVTQRTIFRNSFNEVGSLETAQLGSTYVFPWYDNNPAWGMMGDWIMVGNTDTTDATVDIYIGSQITPVTTIVVPAGEVGFYMSPTPTFDGPVKVDAQGTQDLIVSQRVIYLDSFNEVLGTVIP